MKSQKRYERTLVTLLPRAAVCALMFCSGCLHHRISVEDGYRIDDKGGGAMLVPIAMQNINSEEFQSATVTLPGDRSRTRAVVTDDCVIQGGAFSMHSSSSVDNGSWIVRSPSTAGWDTASSEMDVDGEWKVFIRELARMHDHRCFPSGLSTQFIRSAIVEKIPLPANLVPIFMYSDQGERFVNLAPGMGIRIQKVLSSGTSVDPNPTTPLRILKVDYDVVSRRGGRIGLKLGSRAAGVDQASLGIEDRRLLTLDQRFAPASVLRLFLQGFSEEKQGKSESDPILIGTPDPTQLDLLTDLIRQRNPVACIMPPGDVCVDLPSGSVSLSSIVWINGRRTASAFGTSLASLLFLLPQSKQAEALKSVRVIRKVSLDRYASIQLTRNLEGASQLLLLPGDRIEWKD